jgi:parallel beta-helix repeat protein/predicted outer membrane repeat protein
MPLFRRLAAPTRPRADLGLSALEDRSVPATVTSLEDDGSPGTLRQVIAAAAPGDAIDFASPLSGTITLESGQLVIDKSLTIAGPGADRIALDADDRSRVIYLFNFGDVAQVTISGLTLTGGDTGGGDDSYGGGIANYGEQLALNGVVVSGNSASHGGGVYVGGEGATLTVIDSVITDNTAGASGGGIFVDDTANGLAVSITGTTISDNTADLYGGGIRLYGTDGRVVIDDCVISGNTADTASGGGISLGLYDLTLGEDERILTIKNTTFSDNDAPMAVGGGIHVGYLVGPSLIEACTFSGNTAAGAGGGIYFDLATGLAVIRDTLFLDNKVLGGGGGGMHIDQPEAGFIVEGCVFSRNEAETGGGISMSFPTGAGPDGFSVSIRNTTLSDNVATDGDGGGIYADESLNDSSEGVLIQNCTISGNTAEAGVGGGIYVYYAQYLTVRNTTVTGNVAEVGGGVYLANEESVTFESTIISGNTAIENSPDLYGRITALNCLIENTVGATIDDLGGTITGVPAGLADLADNGGILAGDPDGPIEPETVQTHALLDGSPALDSGSSEDGLEFDQRGAGFVRIFGSGPDIGAFEVQPTGDTTPPTVAGFSLSDTALKVGETATVTIVFSEPVEGFTSADLTVPNGTLSTVMSADGGTTWAATFTPTAGVEDATNALTLALTGVQDAAGNAGMGTSRTENFAIDTKIATLAAVRPVLANGNVVNVDLRGWPAGTPLPWEVVGFEAEYSEAVTPTAGQTAASPTRLRWTPTTPLVLAGATAAAVTDAAGNPGLTNPPADRTFTVRIGDVSGDGRVTTADLAQVSLAIRTGYNPRADIDGDVDVDQVDFNLVRSCIGR